MARPLAVYRAKIVYSVYMPHIGGANGALPLNSRVVARRAVDPPPGGGAITPLLGGQAATSLLSCPLRAVPLSHLGAHTSVPPRPRLARVGGVVDVKSNSWAPMWLWVPSASLAPEADVAWP